MSVCYKRVLNAVESFRPDCFGCPCFICPTETLTPNLVVSCFLEAQTPNITLETLTMWTSADRPIGRFTWMGERFLASV